MTGEGGRTSNVTAVKLWNGFMSTELRKKSNFHLFKDALFIKEILEDWKAFNFYTELVHVLNLHF